MQLRSQKFWPTLKATLAMLILLTGMFPASPVLADDGYTDDEFTGVRGIVTALPNTPNLIGDWKVGRNVIHVTSTTIINQENGKAAVGAFVEVRGTLNQDGSFTATRITVGLGSIGGLPTFFVGTIEELPSTPNRIGAWKVSGRVVHVTASTEIDQDNGPVAVGVIVKVTGLVQPDLSISASEIETRSFSADTKFTGRIEALPDTEGRVGDWKVSGRTIHVSAQTTIKQDDAPVAIGVIVKVEGVPQSDGSINASKIETVKSPDGEDPHVKFFGRVETLPGTAGQIGDWKVGGRTVHVTSSTKIKEESGPVAVGSFVSVEGVRQSDNSINATEIEVEKVFCQFCGDLGFTRFFGTISDLPNTPGFTGEWTVNTQKFLVTSQTVINQEHGPVAVGALVEVFAIKVNEVLTAVKIEVKQPGGDSQGFVRFVGVVHALPAVQNLIGDWTVGTRTIHVTDATRINTERGPVVAGAIVEVKGNLRSDGSIDATDIEVKTDLVVPPGSVGFTIFFGRVSSLPNDNIGDWTVAGRTVHVTTGTKIEQRRGTLGVGSLVEVKGFLRSDGSVDATKITVRATTIGGGPVTLIEFIGKITALPSTTNLTGDWAVDGRTVRVSDITRIRRHNGAVELGALVEVRGARQPDNSVDAITIEVKPSSSFMSFAPLTSVSAGSYQADSGSESIMASFGSNLSATTQAATTLPLPTTLGGVSVLVDGQPAGLFFVSPTQINYLVPTDTASGDAQVTVMNGNSVVAQGRLSAPGVAPSLFTADASGQGLPAGLLLRVRANQQQSYEPLARFDVAQNRMVPVPITRNNGDTLYLVLFGSGFRNAPDSDGNSGNGVAENVEVTIGGLSAPVVFAGPAPGYAGLDQLNVQIPAEVTAGAQLTLVIKVSDGQGVMLRSNTVTVAIQ